MTRPLVLLALLALAAVATSAACTDTTPASQGTGEGVLVLNVQSARQQQVANTQVDFTPEPDEFGAIQRRGDTITYSEFPVGDYTAAITAPGYETTEIDIQVVEDETSEHDITLQPED